LERQDPDPNGDTLLVLRNPDAPFAVWDGPKITEKDVETRLLREPNDETEDEPELTPEPQKPPEPESDIVTIDELDKHGLRLRVSSKHSIPTIACHIGG